MFCIHFFKREASIQIIIRVKSLWQSGTYSLLPGEGDIGTYRDLLDAGEVGDNITPHHMPSAEYILNMEFQRKMGCV